MASEDQLQAPIAFWHNFQRSMKPLPMMGRLSAVPVFRLLVYLSLCCSLSLLAQEDTASSQQQAYTVRGSVTNKFTGQPIARALVAMQGQAFGSVFTDSDGHFEFHDVPAGQCILTAMRPGFNGSARFNGEQHRVQVGTNMPDITIALMPAGAISGQITLSTSDSAENIQVHLLRKDIQNGRAFWQQVKSRTTNSEGRYFFGNLDPSAYRIYTSGSTDPAPDPGRSHPRWGYPPEYFPEDSDGTGNADLNPQPGQHLEADLLLTHEQFFPVTVTVTNVERGASIQVYDLAGHSLPYPSQYSQRDQTVHLDLPPGSYRLEGASFGAKPLFGDAQITVQNAPASASMALLPINPIPVIIHREFTGQNRTTVTFADGRTPEWFSAGVNLNLHRNATGMSGFAGGNLRRSPNSTDNSSFILENIRPGSYSVQANGFQGYVASVTSGGVDLSQHPLVVGPGGTSTPIDVVLRDDSATLSVSLKNQADAGTSNSGPASYICLIPQFSTPSQIPENITLNQAETQIGNLPPGTYRVIAFDAPQQLEYTNPDAMRAIVGKGETVTLAPGGTAQVSLDITSAGTEAQ